MQPEKCDTIDRERAVMEIRKLHVGGITLPSNVLMAPLAGYTCYPFRMMAYELGAGLCFTEMSGANALKYKDKATSRLLFTTKEEPVRAVQLLGGIPAVMEQMACSELLKDFDIIDINMGCPVPNVFKSGEGSALMADQARAAAIIRGCKKSGKVVTVKCRTGIQRENMYAAEFARMMMYDGACCYEEIAQAKEAVSIPVIANGGIFSGEDAELMMERTGADGVMIARYALENPFIFSELTGMPVAKTVLQLILEQMDLTFAYYDETFTMAYIRKLASYGMKGLKGTKKYKEKLYQCGSLEELEDIVRLIFSQK